MVSIDKARWRNLLATGNYFIEIDFRKAPKTLVVGANGSGKTTLIEALCLGLYNRSFRGVNRAKLVNSITNKGLVIEIELSVLGHSYLIRRGIKPNVFEIFKDDILLEPPADMREYQSWLENNVLHMNYRTFCQVVILGSRNYVPFMQLAAAERRSVVENILDIEVFSVMNTLLKNRIEISRKEIEQSDHNLRVNEAEIAINKQRLTAALRDYEAEMAAKQKEIDVFQYDFEDMRIEAELVHNDIDKLRKQLTVIDEEKLNVIQNNARREDIENERLRKTVEFLEHHTTCPTCMQQIEDHFRQEQIGDLKAILNSGMSYSAGVELLEIQTVIAKNRIIESQIAPLEKDLKVKVAKAKENRWAHEGLQKDILNLRQKIGDKTVPDDFTKELEIRKSVLIQQRDVVLSRAKILAQASSLLRDGGVKARVVRKFIPWLNETVNRYLEALDLFMVFEIDEEFNEKIYSRGRDDFTYESLSEGEKLRLDLALLWAWRELGRSRASASVNLLVMDEILDSSLDVEGADEFMKVLDTMADSENVVVISHRGDNIGDKFSRTLRFEKKLNFSQLGEVVA